MIVEDFNLDPRLAQFLKENRHLINQDTTESWDDIFDLLWNKPFKTQFVEILLTQLKIDPARKLTYIPQNYLMHSKLTTYTIPKEVTYICSGAFSNSNISKLYYEGSSQEFEENVSTDWNWDSNFNVKYIKCLKDGKKIDLNKIGV